MSLAVQIRKEAAVTRTPIICINNVTTITFCTATIEPYPSLHCSNLGIFCFNQYQTHPKQFLAGWQTPPNSKILVEIASQLLGYNAVMLHSSTWRHHGSIEALQTKDLGTPTFLPNSFKLPVWFLVKSFKNSRLKKLVVRTEAGYEPKPKVTTKSINFPKDYNELIEQARRAAQIALKDGKVLLEVEFPTAGLDTVPGDEEGGIEMNTSIVLMKEFCTIFKDEAPTTRIFFPDMKDMETAKTSIFIGTSFKLDYLTKPSGLEDIGFGRKVKMADRAQPTDKVFVVAYPYFNVNEMIAVEELFKDSTAATNRPIIVFNGELDRIRSGYYPAFFYPKLGSIAKEFLPKFETVYYIHNFKGRSGGVLFRMYPGPWQVLRRTNDNKFVLLHEQESMPSLKEVALNILPAA